MCRYSVHLESALGEALSPFSVDEGAGRVSVPCDAADCAEFAIVDGELHLSHCGDESSDVRILRNGRTRTVRRGQSFRVLVGDSLCVAGRKYRVKELYRSETPRRRPILTAARTAAMAATAAALLAGCTVTEHHRTTGDVGPRVTINACLNPSHTMWEKAECCMSMARDDADEAQACCNRVHQMAPDAYCVVDVEPLGGDVAPDPVDACIDMNRTASARANCCMAMSDKNAVQSCCDRVHKISPNEYCAVDVKPDPVDACMGNRGTSAKADCCMALDDESAAQACCDRVHRIAPNEFCEVAVTPGSPRMSPIDMCLETEGSDKDRASCCMALDADSDKQACCDGLHMFAPDEYCEVDVGPDMGMMEPPSAIEICLDKNGSANDKAACCMAIDDDSDVQACCDELHKVDPDVNCKGNVVVDPLNACLLRSDIEGKAACCMALDDDDDVRACCDEFHKAAPNVYCGVASEALNACLLRSDIEGKADCCMALDNEVDVQKCCDEFHKGAPNVYCGVASEPLIACMLRSDIDGKASCCMAIENEDDAQKCCDELHKGVPDVYCEVDVDIKMGMMEPPPSVMCMVKDSASDKASCCMALDYESDVRECCDELHKSAPDEYCAVDGWTHRD